ncbi:hypothetical protein [Kitasatospora sp. NPDC089509]|uniref:hypothetical protein n=1 Tax=Kitasatospora sp. NPDC089509 TaxID=3364079 RepID=UPI003829CA73
MVDDQQPWSYAEVTAHLGISVDAARNRRNRGTLPATDDTSVPDRPRWKPSTLQRWNPIGQGHRTNLHTSPAPTPAADEVRRDHLLQCPRSVPRLRLPRHDADTPVTRPAPGRTARR